MGGALQIAGEVHFVILIALGANLPSRAGAPEQTLRASLVALSEKGVRAISASRIFVTPAWPDPNDSPFANAVARVKTALNPAGLMSELLRIEKAFGRTRERANAPRTLDLDLIDYDGRIEEGPVTLPHPRIAERGFVLLPLADVAPGWRHPVSGETVEALIAALPEAERAAIRPIGTMSMPVSSNRG